MRQFTTLLILLISSYYAYCQGDDQFGRLNISTVVPKEMDGFTPDQLKKLETRISLLLTKSNLSSIGASSGIVLYPIITIYNEQTLNPGIQTMTVIDGELSLFLKQADEALVFSSRSERIQGSGRSKEQAMNSLIRSIPFHNDKYSIFLKDGVSTIFKYYDAKCEMLISKAEQLSKANQHGEALSILFNIPSETRCFEKSKMKSLEIYQNYQNFICSSFVNQAKAKLESNNYSEGFEILSKVDPSSNCASEVNSLFKEHGTEVDTNVKRYWDFWESIYLNKIEAEKYRWKAMSEFAILQVTNRPVQYEYQKIIK